MGPKHSKAGSHWSSSASSGSISAKVEGQSSVKFDHYQLKHGLWGKCMDSHGTAGSLVEGPHSL